MSEELFKAMAQSVIEGDADQAGALAQAGVGARHRAAGRHQPGFVMGVNEVGKQYGCGDMFLPDLVMAGEAMKAAVAVLEPEMQRTGAERKMLARSCLAPSRATFTRSARRSSHDADGQRVPRCLTWHRCADAQVCGKGARGQPPTSLDSPHCSRRR